MVYNAMFDPRGYCILTNKQIGDGSIQAGSKFTCEKRSVVPGFKNLKMCSVCEYYTFGGSITEISYAHDHPEWIAGIHDTIPNNNPKKPFNRFAEIDIVMRD